MKPLSSKSSLDSLLEIIKHKPFWIWDQRKHKEEYIINNGSCCFNHIIGLPSKNGIRQPLFDYEKIVSDALQESNHIWIKKATGLGITEFMLRYMAWLCMKDDKLNGSQMCIVTGPRIDLSIALVDRIKNLFWDITFETKDSIVELNGVKVEAFPSHHLDAMRGIPNVSFILLDEGDFFPPGEQQDARDVSERYIAKSNPYIVMISTPNAPGGLFENIELETEQDCLYKRIFLDYTYGLDRIYTREEIEKAKRSPSFEREYNLKYLGNVGNLFNVQDIEAAITNQGDYDPEIGNKEAITIMGIDTGWASSFFGIVIVSWFDREIHVMYASHFKNPQLNKMINLVTDLRMKYMVDKICVDGSDPSFIYTLKERLREWPIDYHSVPKEQYVNMIVEPVPFTKQQYEFLIHDKEILENNALKIHPKLQDLLVGLKSAYMEGTIFVKEKSPNNDLLDALSLCLSKFKSKTVSTLAG
jgi:hypothetical protein